ncbi:LysR family transcriptional regulator [Paraburkholderia acidiphila]|uniref:LysR family transcriptional regulator n=1 Tax=Paraburkholderia acidiphila TaxID=2571747 RepID=A0A7Z2G7R0_9BURK|nr:LysR family transcriptional regulator [Paraburkholderia acidiphila]QGZ56597.1 LysR family transcriptional regulator [Paraburkholderia acidiphila]
MNISLRHLRAFVTIANEGSFTGAADSLCVTQSTLTKTIHELESSTGLSLFNRNTRKVFLSTHGATFLPVAQRIINDFNRSIEQLRQQSIGRAGTIAIASGMAFASTVLPCVIQTMTQRHPTINATVIDDTCHGIINRIANGHVDVGVGSYVGNATNIVSIQKLLTARLGVVFPPGYRNIPMVVSLDKIPNFPVICDMEESSIEIALKKYSPEIWMKLDRRVTVTSLDAQLSMVRHGIGVCIISALAASHPSVRDLPFRFFDTPGLQRDVYIFRSRMAPTSATTTTFISILEECLRETHFIEGVTLHV